MEKNNIKRIIDANLNRSREALRTVEEALRFILNDGDSYKKIRRIRHNADKILRNQYADLIKERESVKDAGRQMGENPKKNLQSVIIANFKRAQEAMRVLEEYSKSYMPQVSPEFKKQRYALYNAEKEIFLKFKKFFKIKNKKN
ncbi:MAG: thiamine-phosphate pyrophosphorylase [Elusimicrobiota bacterium]|jgi:thiamine-phosphate pyrophosphorylase|nr:thiamine-phosphate pyrophosphorylase [Elusimicrobiota bacterium]